MTRAWIGLGSLAGFAAVALAAAGAHALPPDDAHAARLLASAVQILGWHALALLGVGLWAPRGGRFADAAGFGFALGTLLFCGTVVASAFDAPRVPALAPIGGTLLMLGWLALGLSALGLLAPRPRA